MYVQEYAFTEQNVESQDTVHSLCSLVQTLQKLSLKYGFKEDSILLNVGRADSINAIKLIPSVIESMPSISASANISCSGAGGSPAVSLPDASTAHAAASVISQLSTCTDAGQGNFNFSATSCCPPCIPFFPTAYAPSIRDNPTQHLFSGIGMELSTVIHEACQTVVQECQDKGTEDKVLAKASETLQTVLSTQLHAVHHHATAVSEGMGVIYRGIDTSIAPSPTGASLVDAFELLGRLIYPTFCFGKSGSLAIASMMTNVIKSFDFSSPEVEFSHKIGYNGLMLPPLEDTGLAQRAREKTYTIHDLLMFSSVCGIGLDTVPISGNVSTEGIQAIIMDIVSLSSKWDKPLSCRLFPVSGKNAGEVTEFHHPHLCNGAIFDI